MDVQRRNEGTGNDFVVSGMCVCQEAVVFLGMCTSLSTADIQLYILQTFGVWHLQSYATEDFNSVGL